MSKNIVIYYQFKIKKGAANLISIIPDGTFDLLFCCDLRNPISYLWTNPFARQVQRFKEDCDYFGIRFLPEQQLLKFNYPLKELLDQTIPVSDISRIDQFLAEKVVVAGTFHQRILVFEQFMERMQMEKAPDQLITEYAIQKIYTSKGLLKIDTLSKDIGYTDRYIRQKFEEYVGFSPKKFSSIVRFQNALRAILEHKNYDLSDIIFENGYHDQAHFIKSFKSFTNLSPKMFKETLMID